VDAEKSVRQKWRLLKATLDERMRRLWAGTEAGEIGYGGVAAVARATGMAISTVRKGRDEVRAGARPEDVVKIRRSTGKRPYEVAHPEVWPALEKLVDPVTRGDPESPLRWTCKSTHVLSAEMFTQFGIRVSDKTVAKLLKDHDYSLQAPNKSVEGNQHPDRNAQFEHINAKAQDCIERGLKGRLKLEEAEGATFSISNLGADGPDRFTAIINPPQSAILAVGRQRDCVVARDGSIVVRPLSDLTLTVDHRVADGRVASQFLARLVVILEGRDWRLE